MIFGKDGVFLYWLLDPHYYSADIGYWLQVTGYRLLVTGYWLLDPRYYAADIGYGLLVTGSSLLCRNHHSPPENNGLRDPRYYAADRGYWLRVGWPDGIMMV